MAEYKFTALLESDLLQGVNGSSIGTGDVFVMPEGTTVEFIVQDDDNTLSGDYHANEQGDDTTQQTADIIVHGEQVFDDVKIYTEQYHVLQGSDGNYYYMLEIEVADDADAPGDGDDFFTFWGSVPPAGVELTVVCTQNVTCDWVDYTCLEGGELIVIEPENTAPVANDDIVATDEATAITANLLDNDTDNDPISVVGVQGGAVGEAFTVTTALGNTGTVTILADGTFTFDPGDGFKALAQDAQDSFELTYTIADDPQASVKHNLMFVLDISNSTVGAGGGSNVFDGVGVGDVNGDGLADTVLDAEIQAVLSAVQKLIDQGVDPANIDIGIATFSGIASGFASVNAETLGTFALDDGGLATALKSIQSGGWTNYEAGLQEAEAWFAGQAGDGAQNKLVFLSDGRPISGYDYGSGQYITQTSADYGDEVARIADTYGAEIYGVGVGANSDLDYLNDLDNTGGAERVLDAAALELVVANAVVPPATSTATVTVTVNGLNAGPDAKDDKLAAIEGETGSVNLLTNDTDPDGDALTLLLAGNTPIGTPFTVTTAAGRTGSVTVLADGTATFTPDASFDDLAQDATDSVTFDYQISDGQFSDTATVTIEVTGRNAPPKPQGDSIKTDGDTPATINILTNDIDPDGDSLTLVSAGGEPVNGTATVSFSVTTAAGRSGIVTVQPDGTATFDPANGFVDLIEGDTDTASFSYSVSDGQFTETANVTLVVQGTGSGNNQGGGGTVTLSGSVSAMASGSSHIAVVLDQTSLVTGITSSVSNPDLDGDGNNSTVMDLILSKIVDLAGTLLPSDTITLIPASTDGEIPSVAAITLTAGDIVTAAADASIQPLQQLFGPVTQNYNGFDTNIALPEGLAKAEQVLEANDADLNEVLVLSASDTLDQSASVQAAQSLADTVGASIDVLYIEAGWYANTSNLNAIDTDTIDTDSDFAFSLDTLVDPAPTQLAPIETFTVFVNGEAVEGIDKTSVTVNADGTGYQFSGDVDIPADPSEIDILIGLDTDFDPLTAAEETRLSLDQPDLNRSVMDGDTFIFDFA